MAANLASFREAIQNSRFIHVDYFSRRPKLTANTANIDANKYFFATGTSVVEPTFLAGGGILCQTGSTSGNQVLLSPIAATNFATQRFYPNQRPSFAALWRIPPANFQSTGLYWGGLMDTPATAAPASQTDAIFFDFSAGIPRANAVIGGVVVSTNCVSAALTAGDWCKFEIYVDQNGLAHFFFNERLVYVSNALTGTAALQLTPGNCQTGGAVNARMDMMAYSVGRIYSGGGGTGTVDAP